MRRSIALASLVSTRLAMRASRSAFERRQSRFWHSLGSALATTPRYASLAGSPHENFPIIDASELREEFEAHNSLGVTRAAAELAARDAENGGAGELAPSVIAGFSTGTSGGERGLFLANAEERATYIGQSLAKLLPSSLLLRGARIALVLRADSGLYRDVGRNRTFAFMHVPLGLDAEETRRRLDIFAPDILIAPAHVLAALARLDRAAVKPPLRLYWGAEPMGDAERRWIGERFGRRPDPIYQATEGFLAASCRLGRLHLNEDSLIFELEAVSGTSCFRPIITDLRRRTQPVIRVRLDDLVEPDPAPCACGFAGRTILPVAGRVSDLWRFGDVTLTPRTVCDLVESAIGPSAEWQIEGSTEAVKISVTEPRLADGAAGAIRSFLSAQNVVVPVSVTIADALIDGPKRRRIRWTGDHG